MKREVASLAAASAIAIGCGASTSNGFVVVDAQPFTQETLHDDNNPRAQLAVLDRLAKVPAAPNADCVVAVTGDAEITGLDLHTGKTWTATHALVTRPRVAGPLVVGSGGGEVFALDAATGQPRWAVPADGRLLGAGGDGDATAFTLTTQSGSTLKVVDARGKLVFEQQTTQMLGAPTVAAGAVWVPWQSLYVTSFDVMSGAHLATFVTGVEATHVVSIGGALFAGQRLLARIDAGLPKAASGGAAIATPRESLPAFTRRDLYPAPAHDTVLKDDAVDQTLLVARPTAKGTAGYEGDRLYGAYYKIAVGLGATDGKIAWVVTGKSDFAAAAATRDGVVLVDEAGDVSLVAGATGAIVKTMHLGKPVAVAEVSVDALTIGSAPASKSLTAQLAEAVETHDDSLATAQIVLLQALATVADVEATHALLEVADGHHVSSALRDEARAALALRTNGADEMIERLARHASYLHDTHAPPVGPMAAALAAMKDARATPRLLEQLFDPALPERDLLDTMKAIAALATADQVPELQRFVLLYRAGASGNAPLIEGLSAFCKTIVRLKTSRGRAWVERLEADALTDPDVQVALRKLLDAEAAK